MRDPLCFPQLQPAAQASFLAAAGRLADPVALGRIRDDLPIYLFSGSEDPVGQQFAGVELVAARYRQAGVRDVSTDFYPGGRHEMLNETNRGEVRDCLLRWISATLDGRRVRSRTPRSH